MVLHLKDKGHSFDDQDVLILDQEDRWFETGVREAIHVDIENPSFNRELALEKICLPFIMLPFHLSPERSRPHPPERPVMTVNDNGWRRTAEAGFSLTTLLFVYLRSLFRPIQSRGSN